MGETKKARPLIKVMLLWAMLAAVFLPFTDVAYGVMPPERSTVQEVSTFADLKAAIEAGQAVRLKTNIIANGDIGLQNEPLDRDITIYGDGYTLELGAHQFWLAGSHSLSISDLKITTEGINSTQRYGVFCLSGDTATEVQQVWQASFHDLTFTGMALLGTDRIEAGEKTTNWFESADFTGFTNLTVSGGYAAINGVVYARNVTIGDMFMMMDNSDTSNVGPTHPTYQHYFKSPGTGGGNAEPDNERAYGTFRIDDGAVVSVTRSPGQGTDDEDSAYYRSLIFGYADYYFGEGSGFYAKAGTNRTTGADLPSRSAIIRANNASSFVLAKEANVKLETDLVNTSESAVADRLYGVTALSLKKSAELEIMVSEGALLDIYADGRGTVSRGQAPVVLWGKGGSSTVVDGTLNVYSENGNGWDYAPQGESADPAQFHVTATGRVDILANNQGTKGAVEYAAFAADGQYDVEITVMNGGKMAVNSNGYRAMSLAGAGGYNQKRILVSGAGSELVLKGVYWAVDAETRPTLAIEANAGGKIDLSTTGEIGDGYDEGGSTPHSIYSTGPTSYIVSGSGSEIKVYHSGGTGSTIFHDSEGPLKIFVKDGGKMDVYNKNSGTDLDGRRAAITAQNTISGLPGSDDNEILVTGAGSVLWVTNDNPSLHSDTGLYPTGAISFNETSRGNVRVTNQGSFQAISTSPAPTIHLFEGKVTLDNPREFDIRNNSHASDDSEHATSGQAIYNERLADGKTYATALVVSGCDVQVWGCLKNRYGFDEAYLDNRWADISFAATNKEPARLAKQGIGGDTSLPFDQFDLSGYGRIRGQGQKTQHTITYDPNSGVGASYEDKLNIGEEYAIIDNDAAGIYKTDFMLSAWNTKVDGTGVTYIPDENFTPTEDLYLYAQWCYRSDPRLLITYQGGSGNGSHVDAGLTPGSVYEVRSAEATGMSKAYSDFTGWNTRADGGGINYAPGETIEPLMMDLTLYAQWEYVGENFYTITYDGLGPAAVYQDTMLVPGQTYTIKSGVEAAMVYPGMKVGSWRGSDGYHYEIGKIMNVQNNLILYANWVVDQ